ncbi:MAG: glutathione S-transferase family protein [Rhodospirillales bacterium]
MTLTLIIGNKNYSSWSLRPWLAMKQANIEFTEKLIPLLDQDWAGEIAKHSPSLKVPVLKDGGLTVWDSLAILEYLAEKFPGAGLWPSAAEARAQARAVAAEMHSGFSELRSHMPMNIRKQLPGKGRKGGVDKDIERVTAIWRDCRRRFGEGGDFLFGGFTCADAMFAPVASRFRTYAVELDDVCRPYAEAVLALPAFAEWAGGAELEPWTIAAYEVE